MRQNSQILIKVSNNVPASYAVSCKVKYALFAILPAHPIISVVSDQLLHRIR